MYKPGLMFLPLVIVLAACSERRSAATQTETVPVAYTVETSANDTTVTGQDNNNDGVRDDIESKIRTQYPAVEQKLALASARALQQMILMPEKKSDQVAVYNIGAHLLDVQSCYNKLIGFEQMDHADKDITHMTLNNNLRMDAYLKANSLLSGGAYNYGQADCQELM